MGIKSLQGVYVCVCTHMCVVVVFVPLVFHVSYFFWCKGHMEPKKKKKVPTLHTNTSHSHRLAAEDGKKSGSDQRRVKSVD